MPQGISTYPKDKHGQIPKVPVRLYCLIPIENRSKRLSFTNPQIFDKSGCVHIN